MPAEAPTRDDRASAAGRLARQVSDLQASLLARLREEMPGEDPGRYADAAQRLAREFGSVTAIAVDAAEPAPPPAPGAEELASLYQPGHMRRRLDQMLEAHRRYGHPFALVVFDASGPDIRDEEQRRTVLAVVGSALRESIRLVDEAFPLEEDAICVLAPGLGTVEGVQMAERLLGLLEELERGGGMQIAVAAGVVACPDHGGDAEHLLHEADTALWRARALGQPVGVGQLKAVQDR